VSSVNYTHGQFIEAWSQEILLAYYQEVGGIACLPIPIHDIAERLLSIKVDTEHFRGKLQNVTALSFPYKRWVLLNQRKSHYQLRYGLAHEIAHILIEIAIRKFDSHERVGIELLRSSNSKVREQISQYFAGCLLMPRPLIVALIESSKSNDIASLKKQSNRFDTSVVAFRIRIEQVKRFATEQSSIEKQLIRVFEENISQVSPAKVSRFILVKSPKKIFDHRFIKSIEEKVKSNLPVYFVLSSEHDNSIDFLSELGLGDGFVVFNNSGSNIEERIANEPDIELLDLEYLDNCYSWLTANSSTYDHKSFLQAFTSDPTAEVAESQLLVTSVDRYTMPDVELHTRTHARQFIRNCHTEGKTVVLATGCFDMISDAHVEFLQKAKSAGDILVVGVENDYRINYFKKPPRPVNSSAQRIKVLNALRCVDFSFVIHGSTRTEVKPFYTRLYRSLGADILAVTDGDPHMEERRSEIEAAGGQLLVVNRLPERSTSSILRQFLSETVFADMVFVRKKFLYSWHSNENGPKQLELPFRIPDE